MKRLSYPNKFLLVTAFFAVPLLWSLGQLAVELGDKIEQADKQRISVAYLRDVNTLVRELEELRDLGALQFLTPSPTLNTRFHQQQNAVQQRLQKLSLNTQLSATQLRLLNQLPELIEAFDISPGMEAARIAIVFANAQRLISPAHDFRRSILLQSGLLSGEDLRIFALLELISNDVPPILQALGETRVYGSYYLNTTYLDSEGVEATDQLYQTLDQSHHRMAQKALVLSRTWPSLQPVLVSDYLASPAKTARDLLDDALIQSIRPDGNWQNFEQEITSQINQLYEAEDQMLAYIDQLLAETRQVEQLRLVLFLSGLGLLILIFLILFYAFYRNLRDTIHQLSAAALAVAKGEYDHRVSVDSHDEMQGLANAMEQMRIQLQHREEELRRISTTDALTGLRNRKYFDERLEEEACRARRTQLPISLILIDVDHFKSINDTYGHQAGDQVLRNLATHLAHSAARSSDVVSRYGGEEMAIILPETDLDGALQIAERTRRRIENWHFEIEGKPLKITISLGVSSRIPQVEGEELQLIAEADSALYQAKAEGRNRCCVFTDITSTSGTSCPLNVSNG